MDNDFILPLSSLFFNILTLRNKKTLYAYLHIFDGDMYAIILNEGSLSAWKAPTLHESSVPKL